MCRPGVACNGCFSARLHMGASSSVLPRANCRTRCLTPFVNCLVEMENGGYR